MKKLIFLSASFLTLIIIICFKPSPQTIVGHWTITYKSGQVTKVQFMNNGTFFTEIPSEHFSVSGKYKLDKNVLSISDTSCNANYWGRYKIAFHGNDSIYSVVIQDTCSGRKESADQQFLVRDK